MDYVYIIYDKPFDESFKNKIESIQYKAWIARTGAIQRTSRECLYQELGLESLSDRWKFPKLTSSKTIQVIWFCNITQSIWGQSVFLIIRHELQIKAT